MPIVANAPANLGMQAFRSVSDRYGSLAKTNRFIARLRLSGAFSAAYLDPAINQDLTYLCEVGELPGRAFNNMDVRYYGPNQKLPFQPLFEDITLNFLCRNESLERQFFDDWQEIINPNNLWDFNYRDDYAAEIDVFQYSDIGFDNHEASYVITMHDAYPLIVNPQPMTWADDGFQRLVVTFTYTSWSRPSTTPPGNNSLVDNATVLTTPAP